MSTKSSGSSLGGIKVLVVTNDFPPRRGGIESFLLSLCRSLPSGSVVVYTARMRGSGAFDAELDVEVVRDRRATLLPTRRVRRRACELVRHHRCQQVVFGAAAPLALMADDLRGAGATRIVAITHGHETWWARLPVTQSLLRRIGNSVDVLTYVSEHCRQAVAAALSARGAARLTRMPPGVDLERFSPAVDGRPFRDGLGIAPGRPVVLAAARLVARKGHDQLIAAWPRVLRAHPAAILLVVGDGPARAGLARRVMLEGLRESVRLVPGVEWVTMPSVYAAADVFALPCRTRRFGLEPEALGLVFLEAAASGLPLVVGRSGGAPETVQDGETGHLVDPGNLGEIAGAVVALLDDPEAARAMGRRGRSWVAHRFSEQASARTFTRLLQDG
ncbi:MAG: glycosyltransferase family 4 protein [Nocardioidaceae bacterium]